MVRFLDGPASSVVLSLRRVPMFLRVVQDADGSIDALDQLDDEARPGERIFVYVLDGEPTRVHLRVRGGGRCEWLAAYRLHAQQPGEDVRENDAWRAWVGELVAETDAQKGDG